MLITPTLKNDLKRILLVEDDPESRAFLEVILSDAGYEVVSATNGLDAYRKAHQAWPDLVVSDVAMPIMDGIELSAVLRAQARVPVVLVSAHARPESRKVWDEYLDKPVSIPDLLGVVKRLTN